MYWRGMSSAEGYARIARTCPDRIMVGWLRLHGALYTSFPLDPDPNNWPRSRRRAQSLVLRRRRVPPNPARSRLGWHPCVPGRWYAIN
jgi:hypothetical protein